MELLMFQHVVFKERLIYLYVLGLGGERGANSTSVDMLFSIYMQLRAYTIHLVLSWTNNNILGLKIKFGGTAW